MKNLMLNDNEVLNNYLNEVVCWIKKSRVILPINAKVSIYHHKGIEKIWECGAVFINVVNKGYCKNLVIMLTKQEYPIHYHKIKEETYYVLHGKLHLSINNEKIFLEEGEVFDIERGIEHSFWGEDGVIFEELSTTYVMNDSFYLDENVMSKTYVDRKTNLSDEEYRRLYEAWKK